MTYELDVRKIEDFKRLWMVMYDVSNITQEQIPQTEEFRRSYFLQEKLAKEVSGGRRPNK